MTHWLEGAQMTADDKPPREWYCLAYWNESKRITVGFTSKEEFDEYWEATYFANPEAREKLHVIEHSAYEELERKLAESIKDCQRLLQIQVEMNDRLSKFDFPIDDFEGYYDEQRKIEKPYALKRHDEICDELEASNYAETEIVLASVGIWKGIESERKHKNEKLKQLKDIAANEQHWRVEAETEIKDLREKLTQTERERDAAKAEASRWCEKTMNAHAERDRYKSLLADLYAAVRGSGNFGQAQVAIEIARQALASANEMQNSHDQNAIECMSLQDVETTIQSSKTQGK